MLRSKIHMLPYSLQIVQSLGDRDYEAHIKIASYYWRNIQIDEIFLNNITHSGECVFQMDVIVNKHNVRVWGVENPHERREEDTDTAQHIHPRKKS